MTMRKFDVEVRRTIYLTLLLEAETEDEAEKIAKEDEKAWTDLNFWKEDPSECRYYVQELKA
jgi:hypothetical protein